MEIGSNPSSWNVVSCNTHFAAFWNAEKNNNYIMCHIGPMAQWPNGPMAQYFCKQSRSRFRLKKFEPELGSFLTLFFRIIGLETFWTANSLWSCVRFCDWILIMYVFIMYIICLIILLKAEIQDQHPSSLNWDRHSLQKYWAINLLRLYYTMYRQSRRIYTVYRQSRRLNQSICCKINFSANFKHWLCKVEFCRSCL